MEELKPCPFCGAEAVKSTIKPFDQFSELKCCVRCSKSKMMRHEVYMYGRTEEEAVALWNRRAADERLEDDLK